MRKILLSGLLLTWSLATPAWAATPTSERAAAAIDADGIVQRLTRPPPMTTPFVELRESSMLKKPMRLSGEYRRPDADTLVREVRVPYLETTTIRGDEATLARDGRATRTFSLTRVPELAALQGGFGALLSGDRALLEQHYTLDAAGTADDWMLTMTPKNARSAARLTAVVLRGRGADLRCIETVPREGDAQPTLLGSAAVAADATGAVDTLDDALRLCRERAR